MDDNRIPVIDYTKFKKDPQGFAEAIKGACMDIGFFYLINHPIPQAQVDEMFDISKNFFDSPMAEKEAYLIGRDNLGYTAMFQEKLDEINQKTGDNKESFNLAATSGLIQTQSLPQVLDAQREKIAAFAKETHRLSLNILRAFAIALQIPENQGGTEFFTSRHDQDALGGSIFRILKYPKGSDITGEVVRAGSHSDYGSITLLFQQDVPGLEVQANRTTWVSAPIIPGSVLVNVGDQLEFWTGGLFKSTKHRVTFLPEHAHKDRYSIAIFDHPNDAVLLNVLPSPLVTLTEEQQAIDKTAGEHLRERLEKTYTYKD
ncbi:hypothetical protein BZG36_04453 [Bifiguratus adelaidae]|uniref:Fe2OG dioxygenase domain-containing protein n=1 Tax=Bifiguratus adelaidae TaxID=1938954 RepID=A0A261XVQ0_9FUNG|nr:hypothetical protein BZG36_04453 [Bifiguratus adelaidae]